MNQKKLDQTIIDAAKKFLNHHPPNFKLYLGEKSYTTDQIMQALEEDKKFREWFVTNVLNLSTEIFLRGRK